MGEGPDVSTGSLIRAVLFAARAPVTIEVLPDGRGYGCSVRDLAGSGNTLALALHAVLDALTEPERLTVRHAARRVRVRLPEGGLGTLTRVSTQARIATVRTDEGRWRHLPADALVLYEGGPADSVSA